MSCPSVVRVTVRTGPAAVGVATPGPPGPPGPQGESASDLSYLHLQPTPSATWTINHNLGLKPVVQLFTTGSQEFDGLVTHTSNNQCVATMTAPVAGFARLT